MQVFSTTVPQHQHSRSRLCFPQPIGKWFSTAMWLLAKVSVHFASLLRSILTVIVCGGVFFVWLFFCPQCRNSLLRLWITYKPIWFYFLSTCFAERNYLWIFLNFKKINSILKKIIKKSKRSPENGRQLQILFGRVTMVITLLSHDALS